MPMACEWRPRVAAHMPRPTAARTVHSSQCAFIDWWHAECALMSCQGRAHDARLPVCIRCTQCTTEIATLGVPQVAAASLVGPRHTDRARAAQYATVPVPRVPARDQRGLRRLPVLRVRRRLALAEIGRLGYEISRTSSKCSAQRLRRPAGARRLRRGASQKLSLSLSIAYRCFKQPGSNWIWIKIDSAVPTPDPDRNS